jgi:beta-lactamase superfamily II metal-dependent hydrolase
MNKKIIILVVLVLLVIVFVILLLLNKKKDNYDYDLKIHFFNAGKADAMLISKNNKYIMIDTGEESLSNQILDYFSKNNINKLDYLIITHFDKDHVGSASKILDNIEVDKVLESNYPKDSIYYNNYRTSLEEKNIEPIVINGDYEIEFDDIYIIVNGPYNIYEKNESNNSSLIVSAIYKDNKFLFMGDAENKRIEDFNSDNDDEYDFLKVPYHGNYLKKLDNLIKDRNIKYAVITSSNKKLEDSRTIDTLNKYGIKYYLTRNGSINILSNGKSIKIEQ